MKAVFEKYSGENLDQFYNDYINGTKQLDMNKYMNYAGLELFDQTRTLDQPYLGMVIESGNKIKNVSTLFNELKLFFDFSNIILLFSHLNN